MDFIEFVVLLVFGLVIGLVLDLLAALFALWITPYTGIDAIQSLGYWNWFATAILVTVLVTPAASRAGSNN